jgi:DNA-binding LacI/PurR family transcriptional regulator
MCGVSQGTVDRALNNRPGISKKTRRRILETAEKIGYRPHFLARSLAKGRTMTIGLIVLDLYNRFFAQLVNSIEYNARQQDYFVYLTLTGKDGNTEKACIEHLMSRQVDGLILLTVNKGLEFGKMIVKIIAARLRRSLVHAPGPPFKADSPLDRRPAIPWRPSRSQYHPLSPAKYFLYSGVKNAW